MNMTPAPEKLPAHVESLEALLNEARHCVGRYPNEASKERDIAALTAAIAALRAEAAPLAEGREVIVTDAMVERAARALAPGAWKVHDGESKYFRQGTSQKDVDASMQSARIALAAAVDLLATPTAQRVAAGDDIKPDGFDAIQIRECQDLEQMRNWAGCMRRERDQWRERAKDAEAALAASPPRGAVMTITMNERGGATFTLPDLPPGEYKLYTHPAAQADARGVVIDDAMIERATEVWYTMPTQTRDPDRFRKVLTAALHPEGQG